MAKIFSIHFLNKALKDDCFTRIKRVSEWLFLEFGNEHPIEIFDSDDSYTAVIGYTDELDISPDSGVLGVVLSSNWKECGQYPDGNYFLYRKSANKIELVSDYCASRSIWYYANDGIFCFSSMQLPIVLFLGDFKLNKNVISWMISSGTLGPDNGWDERLVLLKRNTSLIFNFGNSVVKETTIESKYDVKDEFDFSSFVSVLKESVGQIELNPKSAIHLLSGGVESRLLLSYIAKPNKLPVLTWGLTDSNVNKNSEINISKLLSKQVGLEHRTVILSASTQTPEQILDKFLKYGEGRVDHIGGYIDGFGVWEELQKLGFKYVVRGDHNFGRKILKNGLLARKIVGCELVSDYSNLKNVFTTPTRQDDHKVVQGPSESMVEYVKRIGIDFRHPLINSALSDLKLCFTEIVNPLLNKYLLEYSESIPDKLITDKRLSKKVNAQNFRDIPYPKNRDGVSVERILDLYFRELLRRELELINEIELSEIGVSSTYVNQLQMRLMRMDSKNLFKQKIKSLIPKRIKQMLFSTKGNTLSDIKIAFRILILIKMNRKISSLVA